jgi:hypothetical protein
MKAVLTALLAAIIVSIPVASGFAEQSPQRGWRCDLIPDFTPYCEAIRASVEDPQAETDVPAKPVPHEAGTRIALDFENKAIEGGEISVLLLALDRMLPDHVGTLEIRNLRLQGRVKLENTTFTRALSFDEAHFSGDDDGCGRKNGIMIASSHFHKPVHLSRVSGCGGLIFVSSHFGGGLLFGDANSFQRGRFTLNHSRVDRGFFLYNMRVGGISIALSTIDVVNIVAAEFAHAFEFRDSEVFSLSVYQTKLPERVTFRGNRVRDSARLSELSLGIPPTAGEAARVLYVADNSVAGRLVIGVLDHFKPAAPPAISPDRAPFALQLHHNQVGGSADVFVEEDLPATIDLRGSKFASELVLTRACMAGDQQDEAATPSSCQQRCGFGAHESGFCAVDPDLPRSAPEEASLKVELAAAEIGSLVWNLRGGNVKWSGPGLRYAYWDPERRYGERPFQMRDPDTNPMEEWLQQLDTGTDKVDPLTFASEYLREHGFVAEAARTRQKALESNHRNRVKAEFDKLAGADKSPEIIKSNADKNPPEKTNSIIAGLAEAALQSVAFLGSVILYMALAPVGWGARPEWALLGMAALVLVFWMIYLLHSWRSKRRWPRENWHSWQVELPRMHVREVFDIVNGQDAAISAQLPPPPAVLRASVSLAQEDPPAYSRVPGFNQYNSTFPPRQFSLFLFSLDATLPVISLHHFDRYYPTTIDEDLHEKPHQVVRHLTIIQHGLGWWFSTVFVASMFI